MAHVQKQFEAFHEAIKLKRFKENADLREKRDRVVSRLKDNLRKLFEDQGLTAPSLDTFDQGSYAMDTGVKPLQDGDFDIDVGVQFNISKDDYTDPVEVKEWVYEALKNHTKRVEVRRPCVTVFYSENEEPLYHVDLAIYSASESNADGKMYLAKGKTNSGDEFRVWEVADPQGLMDAIDQQFSDADDARQFRRVIRYLKRWKDVNFKEGGHSAPVGIALTVAAYNWLQPKYVVTDPFSGARQYDDRAAVHELVASMLGAYTLVNYDDEWASRLAVNLPVEPYNDLLDKMTNRQMAELHTKLEALKKVLEGALAEADPVAACEALQGQFGDDFPVPPKQDTAKKMPPSIISSSSSAR